MTYSYVKEYEDFELRYGKNGNISINDDGFKVEINPQEEDTGTARIILITEEKFYNENVISSLCDDETCLIIPEKIEESTSCNDTERVSGGDYLDVFGVKLDVINQDTGFGYLIDMRGVEFLVASRILDRKKIRRSYEGVNIAFLPLLNSDDISDLIKMAVTVKPSYFVPIVYSDSISESDIRVLTSELDERNIPILE